MCDTYLITLATFKPGQPPIKFVTDDLLKVAQKYEAFMVERLNFKSADDV